MVQAVADLVGPDLRVLFCGINPGKLSGDLGLHFARPGNRFWKLLCAAGFTESVLPPSEQDVLPTLGIGITNLVARATSTASELRTAELREGHRTARGQGRCPAAPLRRRARPPGVPDGFSQTGSLHRPAARAPQRRPPLAPPQPERFAGPLPAAGNERDVQVALCRHRGRLTGSTHSGRRRDSAKESVRHQSRSRRTGVRLI